MKENLSFRTQCEMLNFLQHKTLNVFPVWIKKNATISMHSLPILSILHLTIILIHYTEKWTTYFLCCINEDGAHSVCACPKSGACNSVVVVFCCISNLFFRLNCFTFVISGPFIADYVIWVLLIDEGRTLTYSC